MLQVAKDAVTAAIEIYNGKVAKYNAVLEAAKARAAIYESRVRAAGFILEQYKAEIEAQKLYLDAKISRGADLHGLQQSNAF
jgi:hypothetical protein